MRVPDDLAHFLVDSSDPYIQNGTISHGRAAEILEMDKWSLIQLYGSLDIPYVDMDKAELERDVANALAACK